MNNTTNNTITSLVPYVETSVQFQNEVERNRLKFNSIRYNEEEYQYLCDNGFGPLVESYKNCCTKIYIKKCMNPHCSSFSLTYRPCRKRGCPVCNKKDGNLVPLKYSKLFDPQRSKRIIRFSWSKAIPIKERKKHLNLLEKKLRAYGYVIEAKFLTWEPKDNEGGIHFHCHYVLQGHFDPYQQRVNPKVYDSPSGKQSIFEHHTTGKTQFDGYLNIWALNKIFQDITDNQSQCYIEKIDNDTDKCLNYVLKYITKPYRFVRKENLLAYVRDYKNFKLFSYGCQEKKQLVKVKRTIRCGCCNSQFDTLSDEAKEDTHGYSQIVIKYIDEETDKVLKIFKKNILFKQNLEHGGENGNKRKEI